MANLRLKVEAEYENIEKVLNKMPAVNRLPSLIGD